MLQIRSRPARISRQICCSSLVFPQGSLYIGSYLPLYVGPCWNGNTMLERKTNSWHIVIGYGLHTTKRKERLRIGVLLGAFPESRLGTLPVGRIRQSDKPNLVKCYTSDSRVVHCCVSLIYLGMDRHPLDTVEANTACVCTRRRVPHRCFPRYHDCEAYI